MSKHNVEFDYMAPNSHLQLNLKIAENASRIYLIILLLLNT